MLTKAQSHSFPEWLPLVENMMFWERHQAKLGIKLFKSFSQVKQCYLHILFLEKVLGLGQVPTSCFIGS